MTAGYSAILRQFLSEGSETSLVAAYEFGKRMQLDRRPPEELLGLHLEALESLAATSPAIEQRRAFAVLIEAMMGYGLAYTSTQRLLEQARLEADEARQSLERLVVELDLANRKLREVDRLRVRLFSNMTHELRTPLTSIIGFAEDLLDGLAGPLTDRQRHYLEPVVSAGRHLLKVIDSILEFARLQAGRIESRPVRIDLGAACREVVQLMQPQATANGHSIAVTGVDGIWAFADRGQVVQILLNLLDNACKFAYPGTPVTITVSREGEMVAIRVKDEGPGIPPEDLPLLFTEFHQVSRGHRAPRTGSGLGLAITRHLVELQGGTIRCESQVGLGTTFVFTLPCPEEDAP